MGATTLRMRGIDKRFGGRPALDGVDFEARGGEMHALLGENGAGKSTLMNILSGLYQPDAGSIEMDGRPVRFHSPHQALREGVGMVHQQAMLVDPLTVLDNLLLALPGAPFRLDRVRVRRRIEAVADRFGMTVDLAATVRDLSMGERQRVEILKLLLREARFLILDEPTAVLTREEAVRLFAALGTIRATGTAVILISHDLEEATGRCDRVTVLRDGRVAFRGESCRVTAGGLAEAMFGGGGVARAPVRRGGTRHSGPGLTARDLVVRNEHGTVIVREVSLAVAPGEIVGLVGVAGNGQRELAGALTGLARPTSGTVHVGGRDLTGASPGDFIRAGVASIPEDRLGAGIVASMSVRENLRLKDDARGTVTTETEVRRLIDAYGITPPDPDAPAGALSGGNIQRLILARELRGDPPAVVACSPFQGLDLAAVGTVAGTLADRAAAGSAVLLMGDDLETTLGLSDRVAVIHRGRIVWEGSRDRVDRAVVGRLMGGLSPEAAGA
jgi:simple sugar transport system ATP-binding protein